VTAAGGVGPGPAGRPGPGGPEPGAATGAAPGGLRLGIDVGGTFTDFALLDPGTGRLAVHKQLTTPADVLEGLVAGIEAVLARVGAAVSALDEIRHGTTLGSNVVIERKGPPTALLTTRGFRDLLLIQRGRRYHMFDLHIRKPAPLVPRQLVFEVPERTTHTGEVLLPLDEAAVQEIARALAARGIATVAVAFLHAYANPAHERRAGAILEAALPAILVSLSSDLSLQAREYERTSTAVMNAYIRPTLGAYLGRLAAWLDARGFRGRLHVMQCNGGLAAVETMQRLPVRMIESGPAAGVVAAAHYGRTAGATDVLALDMGGTTAKASLIEDGRPLMVEQLEIARVAMRRGSGLPLDVPAVDLVEIGAGGGSIARPRLGTIQVGPDSAGADPGPAAYGRGGREPTVTDANLVLGYLDPAGFLGGRMPLDREAAAESIRARLAEPLGLDVTRAAWGIHAVVNAGMAQALRMVSVARGRDPRGLTLVATGGAAPAHACRLARELGIRRVVLPAEAGVASALGLLGADRRFDLTRTFPCRVEEPAIPALAAVLAELRERARELAGGGDGGGPPRVEYEAAMRYVGQGFELTVPVVPEELAVRGAAGLVEAFRKAYQARYGDAVDEPVEAVHWRVALIWPGRALPGARPPSGPAGAGGAPGRRAVYFPEAGGYLPCPVHQRAALPAGIVVPGPAIVGDPESTAVLLPGDEARVDGHRNLVVHVEGEP
jgi:N-methylhydantoinase A